MDHNHPSDIERLLQRTVTHPADTIDPKEIIRRAHRRSAVLRILSVTTAVVLLAGVGVAITSLGTERMTDVIVSDQPPATTPLEPDPSADEEGVAPQEVEESERPVAPPERWVAVRVVDDDLEVVLWHEDFERVLARHPRTSPESPDPILATDVVLSESAGAVLVGLCCEPVSGAMFTVSLDGDDEELSPATIQGFRADLEAGGSLFARADTFGVLGIQPSFPDVEGQLIQAEAAAADVGVDPGVRPRVSVLVDQALASMPVHEGSEQRGVLVAERNEDGTWEQEFFPLDEPACALVFLANGRVGLLRAASGESSDVLTCTGRILDVLDLATGVLESGVLEFPVNVRHMSVDATGHYLITTGADGGVSWTTLDGESVELASAGYVVADW